MMQRRLIASASCLILLLCMASAHAAQPLPLKEGFQDVRWGADVSTMPQLEKVGTKNMADFYVNRAKSYEVAGVAVPRVIYGATGGKVFAVYVDLPSAEALAAVRSSLDSRIAPGKSKQEGDETVWSWRHGKVRLKLKELPTQRKLAIYYSPLADTVELSIFEQEADATHQGPKVWYSKRKGDEKVVPSDIPLLNF